MQLRNSLSSPSPFVNRKGVAGGKESEARKTPVFLCLTLFIASALLSCVVGCTPDLLDAKKDHAHELSSIQTNASQTGSNETIPTDNAERTKVDSRIIPLQVQVTGFASEGGNCRIAIYLGSKNFNNPDFAIAKQVVPIDQQKAEWSTTLEVSSEQMEPYRGQSLPISVSAFHDSNENEKLDKGAFGIPTERYGFSNNPKRGYGPPKFQETVIQTDNKLEAKIQLQ